MYIFQKNILIVKPLRDALLGFYILLIEEKKIIFTVLGPNFVNHDIQPRPQAQKLCLFFGWGCPDLSLIPTYLVHGRNALLLCSEKLCFEIYIVTNHSKPTLI